jgi:hypothetical protein
MILIGLDRLLGSRRCRRWTRLGLKGVRGTVVRARGQAGCFCDLADCE